MLTLLLLLFMLMLFVSVASAAGRRRRRALERARRAEMARRMVGGGQGANPFGASPFGMLFGELLKGAGGWSRSLEYDERTGRWVDVSDRQPEPVPPPAQAPEGAEPSRPPAPAPQRQGRQQRRAAPSNPLSGLLGGLGGDQGGNFEVRSPGELATFADVGGMEGLKQEVRDTVGLMLRHPEDADRYGIDWNGILLHGPPGVGKTFFAQAIAGEHGLNFIHVSTGDLVGSLQGQSARNIEKAFQTAQQNLPCLLFFDEFDSVAQRRDSSPDQESRRTVNQLLTSLEANRDERGLLVMAATNSIEQLDTAVIRPGRFDRHIRIDLPDAPARRAIFLAELDDRPAARDIDLEDLVRRTEGMTPAAIAKVVDTAALEVFREATRTGRHLELDAEHLLAAIERYGGQDRPTVEHWTWDSIVLDPTIKAQLQQLQAVIEDPEAARRFGVEPPTGLLLAGPPGTGKTTIAKVLAAQARCSFYPISGADVMSKWVGESEANIHRLFERARENRPSIVFIDEIDAIAGRRGEVQVHDSHVNQLLAEIDGVSGQRGVFIVGATNRPDQLDPALLRGGRLSRTVVLGLPDEAGRLALLCLYTARMPTVAVRLEELARESEGMSPADLKALCQEAALAAMARTGGGGASPSVTHEDFAEALARARESELAEAGSF
jgi:transitional endoplasmic reticulum ATPase